MNFAFNTILLFLIIFSGLTARRAYYSKEFSKNYIKKHTFDELVGGIFIGVLLQLSAIMFLSRFWNVNFDFKALGYLLVGAKDDKNVSDSFINIQNNVGNIFLYNISLIAIAIIIGYWLRIIVRKFKLDRKLRFFRFDNEWHYILSGEILEFPSAKISGKKINAKSFGNKYVNILTQVDDHFVVYSGILVEFFLSNEGGLDLLCMNGVKKKMIKKGEKEPETIEHPMGIDIFVIAYNQILNLSVTYYTLEKIGSEKTPNFFKRMWEQSKSIARIKLSKTSQSSISTELV